MDSGCFDSKQTELLSLLKQVNISQLDGYDISRLLFNETGAALKACRSTAFKKLIRTVFFNKFELKLADKAGSDLPLLVTFDYKRKDHTQYWQRFKDIVGDFNELKVWEKGVKKLKSPGAAISTFSDYRKIKKALSSVNDRNVRCILSTKLAELIRAKRNLESFTIANRAAFIFFDGNSLENLIVQYLKIQGITVATMQHGQPVFHGMDRDRINQTMILNFSSDYIMVTGEFSKKQFMLGGIGEDRIFIGGSLRKINPVSEASQNNFALFLDCPTNPNSERDNMELIGCAEKIGRLLNLRYLIKCHPQDDPINYQSIKLEYGEFAAKCIGIGEVLKNKAFGILHASGVYLDVLAAGIKAFCYVNDTFFPLVEAGMDSFSSTDELKDKIQNWNAFDPVEKYNYMSKIIDYYLSPKDVEDRYRDFVKRLTINQPMER